MRVAGFRQSGVLYANHVPQVNIIGGTVSVATLNGAGGLGVFWDRNWGFSGQSTIRKFLSSKEHLDWHKTDLNVAEIITVQDYKQKKN